MWFSYRPYVPVAQRRAQAAREVQKRIKKGQTVSPVVIQGRTIASTFWGKAWCDHLEAYSDYENRLPRGRTYVRNGSVVDLQIKPGNLTALVSGSELYNVTVTITPMVAAEWQRLKKRCSGQVGSVVELLKGRLPREVIATVTDRSAGLFPRPSEIRMRCSCPDSAGMCKHIAAVLYGVGARLDKEPELLFHLRQVDHLELIEEAVAGAARKTETKKKTLAPNDLADVFGIEMTEPGKLESPTEEAQPPATRTRAKQPTAAKPVSKATAPAEKSNRKSTRTVAEKSSRKTTRKLGVTEVPVPIQTKSKARTAVRARKTKE